MNTSNLRNNSYFNSSRTTSAYGMYERTIPPAPGRPLGRGRDYRPDLATVPASRATTRRVPPAESEEFKPETPQLARAATRLVPPPEPEKIEPEAPALSHATTRVVPPPEPEKIEPVLPALVQATNRLVPPPEPEEFDAEMPRRGLLGSLFFWLRGGAAARKQLRLVETVPLGEKRFVAIIHAQGRKYLVGGGTSGVALLTSLDEPASQSNFITPSAKPAEVAG
jgi:hypothetical protein